MEVRIAPPLIDVRRNYVDTDTVLPRRLRSSEKDILSRNCNDTLHRRMSLPDTACRALYRPTCTHLRGQIYTLHIARQHIDVYAGLLHEGKFIFVQQSIFSYRGRSAKQR